MPLTLKKNLALKRGYFCCQKYTPQYEKGIKENKKKSMETTTKEIVAGPIKKDRVSFQSI